MSERPRILLADDEEGLRDLFAFAIEPLGYEIVCVGDGGEALAVLESRRFDLVILDIHMPVVDGLAALQVIRERWPQQRVLMLTASALDQLPKLLAAGVRCLGKPLGIDEIEASIQAMLKGPP